ncbi:temperature dependent protein affecting M2 dsRNA replication-domain-containing protein [Kockovaella imperatae]|uniref:Temperature dependent protein affecting M2 dsRNA replication-domain-containing protein n=1 Tax=Kockovaella imperatae TaxID=4999 RepID=A0A1Y1UD47_9TREE|nr:temperature dependent protein affecting M2 dsRNA replication-domain-containing protein [Kockovaella imperatae]ORX35909.1 temperature dependent protein affecting M2 dsRNA replication-domain-containing protein [Kockovaella imperatae]
MGVRGLDPYLRERKLFQTCPLAALSGSRLGIDGVHYLKTLLSEVDTREPLVASTGGLPLAITARIESNLRALESLRIKPVFVFAGLPIAQRPPPKGMDPVGERELQVKNEAWGHYESGDVARAIQTLTTVRGGAWTDWRDLLRSVLRIFRHRFTEYVISPYLESAQLAYLMKHPKGYIHAMYASTESLLWPVDRVITHIDWANHTNMTFIDKPRLVADVGLNADQFLDVCILAGSAISRTFPPFASDFSLKTILDLVRQYKSGIAVCQAWRQDNQVKALGYIDSFMRARLAVKYSLVLTTEGICMPLPMVVQPAAAPPPVTLADIPADFDEIFSLRLPDELYYHICRGLISPQVVGWLSSGLIVESQPLADSPDYRRFIKDVITEGHTAPRCTTLALLVDALHPQWKQRRVSAHYYYEPPFAPIHGSTVPFTDVMTQSLVDKCSSWQVPSSHLENELRRQNSSTIDIKLCIGALSSEELAAQTKLGKPSRPMDKKDEIVANVIWRFLDVRGFVAPNHSQTLMGKALHAACSQSRVTDRFQESLYLVLELLRAGVVHGQRWGSADEEPLSGGPTSGTEEEQASTLLIMRVLSVLPLSFRPQQWAGPLSRELLVFNSFVRALSKSLRALLEAITVHILLCGDARRNRDDHLDLMLSQPFQGEVNTGFGILAKTYLDVATFHLGEDASFTESNTSTPEVISAKQKAMEFLESSFTSIKLPAQEVERGFRFWDAVMIAIRTLAKEQGPSPGVAIAITSPAVIEAFEKADKWLKPMRP